MNNILSFKSELVSKVVDTIFNTDQSFSEIIQLTQFSSLSKKFDLCDELEKTTEKVVGDFIIQNYKLIKENRPSSNNFMFIKDGRVVYPLQDLALRVVDLLMSKHS